MKKVSFFSILVLALAIGASAFTAPPARSDAFDPEFHWFNSETDEYLGFRSIAAQEELCPGIGADCADAYTDKTIDNQPAGDYETTVQELP